MESPSQQDNATVATLRFMNERFEYASLATQDAIWDWNLQDHSVWWSDQFQTMFGYTADQIKPTADFWTDRLHPEDRERIVNGIRRIIESGQSHWSAEYRFRKADSTYAIVQDRGYVRHDSSNRAIRMVGSMRDITKAKTAEERLKRKGERLRLALESAELGTWDFDPRTGILLWDDKCKELFGLSADAVVDYDMFLKGLHPEDRDRVDKINRDAMAAGSNGYYDAEYRTIGIEDGKLRWVRAKGRSYFDTNGEARRYIGTVLDITEPKIREQKLIEQERQFRLLVTSIPQIVWMTDSTGQVNYISERWEDYTGIPVEQAKPDFTRCLHPDDVALVTESWRASMAAGTPWSGEYRLCHKNTGLYRWFMATIAPLKDESGHIIKWIGSAADVHDQKMIEQELEKRVRDRTDRLADINARLQQSNHELQQFAFVASHDLQEPLRKIDTYLSMAKARMATPPDANVSTYFEKIERSTARMSSLITNLLEYSRLDRSEANFESVDLNKVVADVIGDLEVAITEKSIKVTVSPLPTIQAVSHQMNQLFYNLVGNAVKFSRTNANSFIRIAYEHIGTPEGNTNPQPKTNFCRISVADNGIGFDQKYATKMFEIFQRLNTHHPVGGHGIGLAVCQKIVQNHGGNIWAAGAEGEGAIFFIELPALY